MRGLWAGLVAGVAAVGVVVVILGSGLIAGGSAGRAAYLDGDQPTISAAGFTHPGVFLGLPQLEAVRRRIAAGEEPQASIYSELTGPSGASLVNRRPVWSVYADAHDLSAPCAPESPQGCVMDAGYVTTPGGRQHTDAAKENMSTQIDSAYLNALLYYYSGGKEVYAQNAIRMLNAYGHSFRGFTSTPANNHSGDLFAGWMAETLVRAAEIIRYTYTPSSGSTAFDVSAFESMLRTAFVPRLENGGPDVNNWRTSATDGLMNVAVFLDDRGLYDQALSLWRDVTPSYIYLASDGPRPASLMGGSAADLDCRWAHDYSAHCTSNPKTAPGMTYQNGQNMEICRDMWHSSAGVGGIVNAAETASLQGDDLYGEQRTRIMTGISYMLQLSQSISASGYPHDFCAGAAKYHGEDPAGNAFPTQWDATAPLSAVVAYNHYATQDGLAFPTVSIPGWSDTYPGGDPVAAYIAAHRSGPTDVEGYVTAWQVLTHADVGSGIGPTPPTGDGSPGPTPATPSPSPSGAVGRAGRRRRTKTPGLPEVSSLSQHSVRPKGLEPLTF
ncbi:alginate lyase family protein [Microbacterium flavum]|uniref:Alginate lyase family protein n=1 Tax=Microbacterium flavum TaxID=415216 RepID=A0ABS5XQ48_9MICO|nr:alginate lyase family protein [Microbacterium flavum]MBT8796654.1 alginate lyase family protein [Microbacterium flavum]